MASSVKRSTRITAFIGAILFFLSSVGLSAVVIWDLTQKKDDQSINEPKTNEENNKLQGTKLANFTPVENVESLQIIDQEIGTGAEAKAGDYVYAHYTGAVAATGIIFQSSYDMGDKPVGFELGGVIKGWSDGVPGMKEGGKRRLLIPSDQAYGANPPSADIPVDADLVFDIVLVKVGK